MSPLSKKYKANRELRKVKCKRCGHIMRTEKVIPRCRICGKYNRDE